MKLEVGSVGSGALLAAAAAAAASAPSSSAMAADFAAKAGPMPAPNWQGLYVGGSIGASWLNSTLDDSAAEVFGYYGGAGARNTASAIGGVAGLDIGYNWEDRNFVYGVEADISYLGSAKATAKSSLTDYSGYSTSKTSRIDALSTFRGRFGFDFDGTMPYLTAGIAVADIRNSYMVTSAYGASVSGSKTSWEPGLAVGAGIEHQFSNRWTLRGEVLWVGFKDTSMSAPSFPGYTTTGTGSISSSNSLVLGRVGLNYRF